MGYDQFGQVVKVVDGLNNATVYGYARGLLTSITDANANVTMGVYAHVIPGQGNAAERWEQIQQVVPKEKTQ